MRLSGAAHGLFFLVLTAALFTAEAQSRRRITVRTYRTNYRIDTWDDGRDELYRVTYWKFGLQSVFTFDAGGHVRTLTSRDTLYTFDLAPPSRMLMDSGDDALEDVETDLTPAIDCTTCYNTWNTLCDAGLTEVCFLDANNPVEFDEDADDSVRRFCGAVGSACERTATDVCGDQCDPGSDPEPTVAPTEAPTPEPTSATPASTPAPTSEPTQSTPEPTPAPTPDPTPAPTPEPTPATPEPTPVTSEPTPTPTSEPTPATAEPTPAPTAEPTPATPEPTLAPTPEPTPVPTSEQMDACNPNPCQNGGSCSIDPAGGHTCSCSDGYGGMSCQIDTSALASFFIEVDFIGVWTDSRRAVFQSAADRWSEVVTHVPCGGSDDIPAGRLLIAATLEEIDGAGGTLGFALPTMNWVACPTIILEGEMTFDIDDIASIEADGTFEGVILHEMGHVIGVGSVWGAGLGECSTCFTDGSPAWTCLAALETYADIGGSGANIVETDFGDGSRCGHLDEVIFDQELMTPIVDNPMFLSKMTAATLEDINYIVDTSMVDPYVLPSAGGGSIEAQPEPSIVIRDTAVETVIISMDSDGNIVDEMIGLAMEF